jgi:hypothetical protein
MSQENLDQREIAEKLEALHLSNHLISIGKITWEQRVRVHQKFVEGNGDLGEHDGGERWVEAQEPRMPRTAKLYGIKDDTRDSMMGFAYSDF